MKKYPFLIILTFLLTAVTSYAQVGVGTTSPNASAVLDVTSTSKGLLPPRMTHAQKIGITSPVAGLMVWCTNCGTTGQMQVFNGSEWTDMVGSPSVTASSNGTADISAYALSGSSTGTLTVGVPVSGVTQTITATVTTPGTYTISATANGVTFANNGTFSSTGSQNIILTASGTPTSAGSHTFTLNTVPSCSFTKYSTSASPCGSSTVTFTYNGASVTYGVVLGGGSRCWLDRNLGASQVATSNTDPLSYGDLFQWGRGADGHQSRTSNTTYDQSYDNQPGHPDFILYPGNWLSTENDNLWQGVNGVNNPCPSGFRVPTMTEYNTEIASWSSANPTGAFNSPLKLPLAGDRHGYDDNPPNPGTYGNYWSSTVYFGNAYYLDFQNSTANIDQWSRCWGMPVRCIKN
jgi:hypothetical protein